MSVIERAVGWLAPPQCIGCGRDGTSLCFACSASEIIPYGERCALCSTMSADCRTCTSCRRLGAPRYVWVSTDYEGLAKAVIRKYKFGHERIASDSIGRVMSETFLLFNSDKVLASLNYLIVPIPTATSRVRQRGFDHSVLLARKISREHGLAMQRALMRLGHSRQLGAPRSARLKQLEGSYRVREPKNVNKRNILLIDDVLTTGGTVCAAAKVLRKAGARRVDALVFAKRL